MFENNRIAGMILAFSLEWLVKLTASLDPASRAAFQKPELSVSYFSVPSSYYFKRSKI